MLPHRSLVSSTIWSVLFRYAPFASTTTPPKQTHSRAKPANYADNGGRSITSPLFPKMPTVSLPPIPAFFALASLVFSFACVWGCEQPTALLILVLFLSLFLCLCLFFSIVCNIHVIVWHNTLFETPKLSFLLLPCFQHKIVKGFFCFFIKTHICKKTVL